MDVLGLMQSVPYDDSIVHLEWHTHLPYASMTLKNNDEIRIPIQQMDLCVVPSMSYLYVEGKLLLDDNATVPSKTLFTNNAFAYLFDELRYEVNGQVVDRVRNPGVTTTIKSYVSLSEGDLKGLSNSGWIDSGSKVGSTLDKTTIDSKGNFSFCVPLNKLFGFAEDYKRLIVNARHELVLIRSSSDNNAIKWSKSGPTDTSDPEKVQVKLDRLAWRIPYVTLGDKQKIALLKQLSRGTSIPVEYRTWDLYEFPTLPTTSKHSWTVKTASQLEKPRYVIVGFQTGKRNDIKSNASMFDSCKVTNVKLFLNSTFYPYDDLKLDFDNNHYAVLYDMYTRFQESYYGTFPQPLLTKEEFKTNAPLIVLDCSKQSESIRSTPVDIRLEIEAASDFPANTSAYCLIIHDKSFVYDPSTSMVKTAG